MACFIRAATSLNVRAVVSDLHIQMFHITAFSQPE